MHFLFLTFEPGTRDVHVLVSGNMDKHVLTSSLLQYSVATFSLLSRWTVQVFNCTF